MFDSVASSYDLMNDLSSAGLHRAWKRGLVARLDPWPGIRLLDVAGGTGDVATRVVEAIARKSGEDEDNGMAEGADAESTTVVEVCDINAAMLAEGARRALASDDPAVRTIRFRHGDAEALPHPDESFDAVTIAFGLRNVTRRGRALREMARVLRPGGRLMILEFTPTVSVRAGSPLPLPTIPRGALPKGVPTPDAVAQTFYDLYSHSALPALGKAVAGDGEAYRYLAESIRRFPSPPVLAGEMRAAGLRGVTRERLAPGGLVCIHSGFRV